MFQKVRWLKVFSLIIIFFFSRVLVGSDFQDEAVSVSDIDKAKDLFLQKNYEEAMGFFIKLLDIFPKDPEYNYYAGVCMVELGVDVEKAIHHLKYASIRFNAPNIQFYLGKAYHLLYDFEKAREYLSRYLAVARKAEAKELLADVYYQQVKNATTMLSQTSVIVCTERIVLAESEVFSYVRQRKELLAPEINQSALFNLGKSPQDIRMEDNQATHPLFIATFSKDNMVELQKDIAKIDKGTVSSPQLLPPPVNSIYDEDYPYFDPVTNCLYFASNSPAGMGGYDIYQSAWDSSLQQWKQPVNMGFPVNSPFDDLLFIPFAGNQAVLISNRDNKEGMNVVYLLALSGDKKDYRLELAEQIRKMAMLEPVQLLEPVILIDSTGNKDVLPNDQAEIQDSSVGSQSYQQLLLDALLLQYKTDSLYRLARSLKKHPSYQQQQDISRNSWIIQKEADKLQVLAEKKMEELYRTEEQLFADNMQEEKTNQSSVETDNNQKNEVFPAVVKKNFNEFNVLNIHSVNPGEYIFHDSTLPDGIIYRIQLGAFSQLKPDTWFKGISPLFTEKNKDSGIIKYYAGLFSNYVNCNEALKIVRELGFKDAFIVAYHDKKSILVKRACELELHFSQ